MKGLRLYLSPFAPDTSGAAAVFFGLGALTVIVDAGGCAGNIAGFDEPRWQRGRSAVFSAGLRDMDAIMGRDDHLVAKLQLAAEDIAADFIALVSSPVPAVIGTDFRALARLGKKATGLPVVTADCDGTRLYDKGAGKAWLALMKEFVGQDTGEKAAGKTVGLLGVTPLDFSEAEAARLAERAQADGAQVLLYGAGVENSRAYSGAAAAAESGALFATNVGAQFIAPTPLCQTTPLSSTTSSTVINGLPALRHAHTATENIVVSAQGLRAAKWLQQHFGTPYRADSLLAADDLALLRAQHSLTGTEKILLIHESVRVLSLRRLLQAELPDAQITAASWFMPAEEAGTLDAHLTEEDDLAELVNRLQPDLILADKALLRALPNYQETFIDWPHYAVSGAR